MVGGGVSKGMVASGRGGGSGRDWRHRRDGQKVCPDWGAGATSAVGGLRKVAA